ncbi:hypothetical protein [Olsenella profusa]|uniref:CopG family transcriptional regulator n=1 Tax=Olsenella profusa TaxID=138595 RepID=A0ABS2F1P6_9ACTN|nr:hypothetical protein [Olsenella profusa]MBM6774894.1 CopG family transcriptional regulator [Olsenella profusa]
MGYITRDGTELSDEAIEELAVRFEHGEMPGRWGRTLVGRPRISTEPLRLVGVRVPGSLVEAFDAKAAAQGQTRSQRLRALMERDVRGSES